MAPRNDIIEIDAEKLLRMLTLHVALLLFDVRTGENYQRGHIQGAINIPSEEFLTKLPQMVPKRDTPIVIYDEDGIAAGDLVLEMEKAGFINIVNLEGGYLGYVKH